MKKKGWIIGLIILAVAIIALIPLVHSYINDRYQGYPYYSKVPTTIPKKEQTYNDSGQKVPGESSYKYEFTFVNKDGEKRKMTYYLDGNTDTVKPFKPNSYVYAKISKKIITAGPVEVKESKVPTEAKTIIDKEN